MKEMIINFFIVCSILLIIIVIADMMIKSEYSKEPEIYKAWMKANHSDINFEEWKLLYRNHVLPGQNQPTYIPMQTGN